MLQSPVSVETKASWAVASVALFVLCMSYGSAWIAVVALKDIASEVDGARSVPALASALAWLGAGLGGMSAAIALRRAIPILKRYLSRLMSTFMSTAPWATMSWKARQRHCGRLERLLPGTE